MTKWIRFPSLILFNLLYACQDKPPEHVAPNSSKGTVPETSSQSPVAHVGGTETGNVIMLGKAINPDNTILTPSERFAKTDTIYVSVSNGFQRETPNAGTLKAKWSYGIGSPVKVDSLQLTPAGPTISEFHLNDPQGLPAGAYQVELLLNDRQIAVRTFTVE